ncbi:MAG: hypothetical protein LBQ52_05355 [Helicobacteraceae bacterium]|jgi:hypothetical protein|nr:hypothetical protein [Helicobacteraceae bacterium]
MKNNITTIAVKLSGDEIRRAVREGAIEYEQEAHELAQKALKKLNNGYKFSPAEWQENLSKAGVLLEQAIDLMGKCVKSEKEKQNG